MFFSESLTDFTPRKLVDYIAMVLIKSIFLQDQNQFYSTSLFFFYIFQEHRLYLSSGSISRQVLLSQGSFVECLQKHS